MTSHTLALEPRPGPCFPTPFTRAGFFLNDRDDCFVFASVAMRFKTTHIYPMAFGEKREDELFTVFSEPTRSPTYLKYII